MAELTTIARPYAEAAFRLLYLRYRGPLMRFSQRLTGHSSEAEEIFQETWIAVIDSRAPRFNQAAFPIGYRLTRLGRMILARGRMPEKPVPAKRRERALLRPEVDGGCP